MNDRLARDVELILLVIMYVALTSIMCYVSLILGQSKLVTSAEELMFTQIKYLIKSILSLFHWETVTYPYTTTCSIITYLPVDMAISVMEKFLQIFWSSETSRKFFWNLQELLINLAIETFKLSTPSVNIASCWTSYETLYETILFQDQRNENPTERIKNQYLIKCIYNLHM